MRKLAVGIAVVVGAAACGGSSAPTGDSTTSLAFTRKDGSAIPVPDLELFCEQSRTRLPGQIVALRTADMSREPAESRVMVEVATGSSGTFRLPFTDPKDDDPLLFVMDKPTDNEASTDQEDASGTVVVREASCDPEPRLDVTIDAVLGSENFEGETVTVRGDADLSG